MLHDFRNSTAFSKVPQASPVSPSRESNVLMKISLEHWRNDIDKGNRSTGTKTCSGATSSTTNLTLSDLVSNPALRIKWPVCNRLT